MIILILLLFVLYIFHINKNIENVNERPSLCIVIPARDESKVIGNLLESIKHQTYHIDIKDVYVIVESNNDKTVNIAKRYGSNVLIRTNPELKRKGYALDEGIKQILKHKHYDLYFIFDADNILDKQYIEKMMMTYNMGYDIGIGYRNSKNGNENVVTSCSTLTFSMINQLINNIKMDYGLNVTISGTGFYIKGKYVDEWNGYPFHTLTEDYELTLYSILHNMTSAYNQDAVFYDEQPSTMSLSIKQRTRWVKGYFDARKIYIPKIKASANGKNKNAIIYNIRIIIFVVICLLAYILFDIINFILSLFTKVNIIKNILIILSTFAIIYFLLVIFSVVIVLVESKKLNLTINNKIKAIFFNPFFLLSYLVCIFNLFTNRDTSWVKIDHNENKIKRT